MSVRATTTHIDKYGVTHRVDLIRTGYAGASTELRGSDGFLRFAHENLSEADVFGTPIQRGRLDFGVWIESAGQKAVIDELFLSEEGQFLVQWYINSVLFWTGTVALDLSSFDEGAFPYRAQITAKDLTYLEGLAFPTYADPTPANSFATRRTLMSLIAECLPYGLNIVTATSWVESNIDTAQDFLRQVYLDASVLQGLTRFEALNRILSDNGCFLKQADGVWLIEQLSAHTTPGSVKRWTYNASGVYQSEATVDPRTTANTDFKIVTGSLSSVAPAYKSVEVRYDAQSPTPIDLPAKIRILPGDPPQFNTFEQQYISTYNPPAFNLPELTDVGQERVRFISTVIVEAVSSSASGASKRFFDAKVQIRAGNRYARFGTFERGSLYNVQWTTVPTDLTIRAYYDNDSYDSTTGLASYKAQFNVESGPIVAPTSDMFYGRLSIQVRAAVDVNGAQYNTTYDNNKFELVQGAVENVFRITQTGQYSTNYQTGVRLGDGPRPYFLTALRWQTGALSLDKVTSQWQRRGSTDWRTHSVNLAKEIMDFQRSYARTLQVVARGSYTPSKTLVYDLTNWYYIGGGFDGYTGDWTMTFVRNSFVPDVDALTTTGILTPTQVGVGIVSAIANTATNTTEALGQFLLRLALPASGTIGQLVVSDIDQFVRVKAGQVLRLVHPVTLQSDEVVVSSDRDSGAFIGIISKTLSADYPIGSYVFVSAQSVQAGILVGENAVRIYAEGQSLGRLTADVNGTVTSIDVNLYTRVLRGMEMRVVNSQTGAVYAVTVNQDEAGPGEVTLDIEEQVIYARAGDVVAGDNSFQQSQITVTQGLIVLKVNSNGKVAQIRLGADDLGSEIDISAEQVNINGIVFTEGTVSPAVPGDIKTSNYVAGTAGWKIDGDGTAEFNDVTVRGTIEWPDGLIDSDGISLDLITQGSVTDGGKIKWGDIEIYGQVVGFSNSFVIDVPTALGASEMIVDCENIALRGNVVVEGNVFVQDLLSAPNVGVTVITNANSPYTVLNARYIATNSTGGAITINLPTGTDGRILTVFDTNGTAGTNNITINRASTDTINGATSTTLTTNYQSVTLIFNAGNWTII